MRERVGLHRVKLLPGDLAITLQRVDHVALGAVEALIDQHRTGAKGRQVRLDHGAGLVRNGVQDLDRALNVSGRRANGERPGHLARLHFLQGGAPAHRRNALFDDFVSRLGGCALCH